MSLLKLLPKRKPKVFICYRRDDSGGHARSIAAKLASRFGKKQVFLDVASIEGGEDFPEVTERFASSCDVLIGVIGKQWLTISQGGIRRLEKPGDYVSDEIAHALQRGIPIIPVLVDGAPPLNQQDLPARLEALARRHAIEISNTRWEFDMNRLINRLEEVLPPQSIAWRGVGVRLVCLALFIYGLIVALPYYTDRLSGPQAGAQTTNAANTPQSAASPNPHPPGIKTGATPVNANQQSEPPDASPTPATTPPEPDDSPTPVTPRIIKGPFPVEFSVNKYQKTTVCVTAGTRLQITAGGVISFGPNIRFADPNGKDTLMGFVPIDRQYYKENFPFGALMCKLDSEREWQMCGVQKSFAAAVAGCLEFEVNDREQRDNSGAYSVTVDLHK